MSSICSNYGKINRSTRLSLGQVLLVAFVLVSWCLPVEADERVPIIRRFSGKVADLKLLVLSPRSSIITSQEQWKTLWSQWRPDQELYAVDLDKVLVLVETTPGPNRISSNVLERDSKGNLVYEIAATEKAGAGFGYLIMVIDKSGIKSVKGKPLGFPPIQPAGQPTNPKQKPEVQESPTKQQANEPEVVLVNMTGRVRTQFKSVGTENRKSVISANGIIWELDLSNSPQLLGKLRNANNALANVTGQLSMERERGTQTARLRYIVKVKSLNILRKPTEVASTELPPPSNTRPPTQLPLEDSASVDTRILKPVKRPAEPRIPQRAMAFDEISLVTSDGQLQTILADGAIHYESKSRNLSRDWTGKPEEMEILNQFVKNTQWDLVPKLTRAEEESENEIGYTISIKSPGVVRRFYIERSKVSSQPEIKLLFEILGKMAKK